MLILAQASDMANFPTTMLGLFGSAAALIVADWIKNRGKVQRDESKVSELAQQTQLLREIRDGQDYDSAKNKKARRRIKVMAAQVEVLHEKHIKESKSNEK